MIQDGIEINKRSILINQVVIVWSAQLLLCALIFGTLLKEPYETEIKSYPSDESEVITKFICAVILHIKLQPKLRQGLDMMKFVSNH